MKKNGLLFSITVSLLMLGCNSPLNDEILEENDEISFPVKISSSSSLRAAGDGIYDVLGYGYDCAFSPFKGGLYSKAQVIDINKFKSGIGKNVLTGETLQFNPGTVLEATLPGTIETTSTWGFNLDEYKQDACSQQNVSLTINANAVKMFSGEIKNYFSNNSRYSTSYAFYRLDAKKITRKLTLSDVYPERLKFFFTDEFIYDLEHYTGIQLVEKYGTHVLTDILLGGMGSMIYNSKISTSSAGNTFKNEANTFFTAITTSTTYEGASSTFSDYKDVNIHIRTIGGTVPIAQQISYNPTTGELGNFTFNYQDWLISVNESSEQIIGLGNPTTHIHFLSEFIDDPIKKQEVENAIISHCNQFETAMNNDQTVDYETVYLSSYSYSPKVYLRLEQPFYDDSPHFDPNLNRGQYFEYSVNWMNTKWTFYPFGNYYRIGSSIFGSEYFLTAEQYITPELYNQSDLGQLWELDHIDSECFMLKNAKKGTYMGVDLLQHPKNPNNNILKWEVVYIE